MLTCHKHVDCHVVFFLGKYDHLPEAAFYMVGDIDDVIIKADKLAEELGTQ